MIAVGTPSNPSLDRRGVAWGLVAVAITLAITFVGSDGLVWFDAALVGYLFGVDLRRVRRRLPLRGLGAAAADGDAQPAGLGCVPPAQGRQRRRPAGARRHPAAGPGVHPAPLADPLAGPPARVLGLHPRRARHVPADARPAALRERRPAGRPLPGVRVAGRHAAASTPTASSAGSIFHALDIAAVLVLAGVFIFLRRRLRDPGALAVERSNDFLALAGLFAVSVTGLFLTVSSIWLDGRFYSALNTIHALTVILGLMYIPFGKLFHIFQRPGQPRRRLLQAGQRRGPAGASAGAAARRSPAPSRSPTSRRCCPQVGLRLRARRRRQLPGHLPALPAGPGHPGPVGAGRRVRLMARPPITEEELIARYGPHLNEAPPGGWDAGLEVDRVVDDPLLLLRPAVRHQAEGPRQRGRRLRALVRVPVQRGQALPEGRQALPAGQPPRPAAAPDGARPVGARRVPHGHRGTRRSTGSSARSAASRPTYGNDAFAMLSGVSLDQREELPDRQVRPPRPAAPPTSTTTAGYCMVSAGAGNKKALGIDRGANPWSDIPLADVVWVAGSNVAETFPITTSYIWRARDRGAKLIVAGPARRAARPHRRPVPRRCGRAPTRRCSAPCCTS